MPSSFMPESSHKKCDAVAHITNQLHTATLATKSDNSKIPGSNTRIPAQSDHTLLTSKNNRSDSKASTMTAPASLPLQPSTAYLAVARSLSARVTTSHSHPCRKLLVLDLNGTLLLRSKPGYTIHPRPYMSSFRSYLFHQSVKPWLDVMVWSSARPDNVHKMVTWCFESHRDELKATWARDTLGLSKADYCEYNTLTHLPL